MPTRDALQAYYALDRERDRLAAGLGRIEFDRTIEIIERTLPPAPAVIADIGGGPGPYTDWLVARGYHVIHRDVVAHHVDQVTERHGDVVDSAVGDARDLDLGDATVDVVLLLGPLYHLTDASDRLTAIAEAARVTRSGGIIHAAAIGRWSARLQGVLVEQQYVEHPEIAGLVNQVEADGILPAIFDGSFNGYTHLPEQLRAEMQMPGLVLESLVAVEGPASMFTDEVVDARLADDTSRHVLYDSLRAVEAVPSLLGVSAHLLASAQRVAEPPISSPGSE